MELPLSTCHRARHARDARFDGRFFIAITSTRIYCRVICPARTAKDQHVRYYPSAAAAASAGYRPCLRCRPEASPGTPAWLGTSALVSRALRLISEGALDDGGVEQLAERLGVTARHVRRLFIQHLGATPLDVALTRRVHFAKKLLDETALAFDQVAFAAGFGSVRRFNSEIQRTYHRTPTELRRLARQRGAAEPERYAIRLAFRPPYDWDAVLAFLAARATPGVEAVAAGCYRRTIAIDGVHGDLAVSRDPDRPALALDVRFPDPRALLAIVERTRRLFDLGADPAVIAEHLGTDPQLRRLLAQHPGVRSPGAWDGFELAVRALLGPPTAPAASALAGQIAARFGTPAGAAAGLAAVFPAPAQLVRAPLEELGLPAARATAVRTLAREVASGALALGACIDGRATLAALAALPGIDASTAEYIAMRALGEPDALPSGDAALVRCAGAATSGELERRAEAWRPWRAYAAMLLWGAES